MAISRYAFNQGQLSGKGIGTSDNMSKITAAVETGAIICSSYILEEGERLDTIAGRIYGDSKYWWIIAAASNIGWALQVPPGTMLRIPRELDQIMSIIV